MFVFSDIDLLASQLVQKGLRTSTYRTYSSAQRQYVLFCTKYSLQPVPASQDTLLRFVAYGHAKGWTIGTFQVYLASIAALHKLNGYQAPDLSAYKLKLALKAVKDTGPPVKHCAPITYNLLTQFIAHAQDLPQAHLWTAMLSFGYFGAMRGAEYTAVPAGNGILKAPQLKQLQFVSGHTAPAMQYVIIASKTSSQPVAVNIGCSGVPICAVCMMQKYLIDRATHSPLTPDSYLFAHPDSRPVTKFQLNAIIKQLAQKQGLTPEQYTTHSLRAGAATTASLNGFSESDIQHLGHWSSTAYLTYIRGDTTRQFSYASKLL